MKKLAYFKIEENMTPRDASDILAMAKKAGYNDVLVYHHEKADITNARYKEQLLSVFRAAYRHKVGLYIADDRYDFSGTGFGQLSSVKDLWQKIMVVKNKDEVSDDEEILCEDDGRCVVVTSPKEIDKFPYGHMPDLTNPECARLIIESVYKPLINEYKKFVGYEFKGFLCNPLIKDCVEYEGAPYCEAAVQSCKGADLFSVVKNKSKTYLDSVYKNMKTAFADELKKYCREHSLEFLLSEDGRIVFGETCYIPDIRDSRDALLAYSCRCEGVIEISPAMNRLENIGKIFEEYPDCELVDIAEQKIPDKDCYIIRNTREDSVSLGFLLQGDWCVYDWEKDELYDFEPKATYSFSPLGFMCIVRKTDSMYTDKLPVRVGSVVTWDYEESETIKTQKRDDKYAFYLPDETLSDKAVKIEGTAECIKVKLGAMEHHLTEKPFIVPLFDFQREAGCIIEAVGGEIEKIAIITKKQME